MADWDFTRSIDIMRRVIGRRNATDSLSNDTELQSYLGEFMRDIMPQELKTFENFDTYIFDTVADTEQYTFNTDNSAEPTLGDGQDINGKVFNNIGPVAYSDEQLMNWFQSPELFHAKWGFDTDVSTVQTAQPIDILFHNDRFTLKPRPDGIYRIRIFGYRMGLDTTESSGGDTIQAASSNIVPENYWARYIIYGASLDYMYDFGYDAQRISVVESRFKHYKALVQNRTLIQSMQKTVIQRW